MLEKIFDLKANGTSVRQELRAGLTSFMAMCYLIFVVPSMLADAGMPRESAVAAVIWVTIAITLLMGLWARFPVGVAPGLGITAFFAYYVCGPAGYSWQTGLGAVFISGVFFMLLTVTRVRQMIIDAVPMDLKYAIVVGIGAFIAFIGLKNCGIVVADPSTFVTLGPLTKPEALLALFFTPLVAMVPAYATAPVLVLVGALMMQEVVQIKFRDLSVAIPAFLTIIAMPLTFNIATGFGFGFISFVVLRVLTGRRREVSPIMYIVAICFAANFALRG